MKIIAEGLMFPEGPVALPDGSLLFVEIARETVTRLGNDGRTHVVAQVPGGPNGLAIGPDGHAYVCNNGGVSWIRDGSSLRPNLQSDGYRGGSIDRVDLSTGRVETLYDRCGSDLLRSPNDLVFDRVGGFWFTDTGKRRSRDMDRGFVYYAKADGSDIRQVTGAMMTPNGIGLSPDENTLYVAETDTGRLWSWEVLGPGELRQMSWPSPNGGRLVKGFGDYTRFDSLAVTASGNVCIAALSSCAVLEVTPDGTHSRRHPVPDLGVSNLCFGGPQMRTAFITLAHEGRIAATEWWEAGLRLNYCDRAFS